MNDNYFQMQHFITNSNWGIRHLIYHVANEECSTLPKKKITTLIIDEIGWVKKDGKIVGVGRQYCCNVRKSVNNSHVVIFDSLSIRNYCSLVDVWLYLHEDWHDDTLQCNEAGSPEYAKQKRVIIEYVSGQADFDFISANDFYGNDAVQIRHIDKAAYLYMFEIHNSQTIYLSNLELHVPLRKCPWERTPEKLEATTQGITTQEYLQTLRHGQWKGLTIRNTDKETLTALCHFAKVWIWNKGIDRIGPRLLVNQKSYIPKGEEEIKIPFTNANLQQFTPRGLAYMQTELLFVGHSIFDYRGTLIMIILRKIIFCQSRIKIDEKKDQFTNSLTYK